jgi:DNA-binding FadR family transcriptional regulator
MIETTMTDELVWSGSRTRQRTTSEAISDRILAAVAVGVLQPGEQLPAERELAEMLEVSRTTIRQALARLAALGIIESRRGRAGGTFVADRGAVDIGTTRRVLEPIRREMESLHDYRALVQETIARTAAVRHGSGHDAVITAALAAYTDADGVTASRLADRALHDAIAAAAGNEHLALLARELSSRVNLGFAAEPYSAQLRETARQQHQAIVDAVLAGDHERAGRLAGEHFRLTSGRAWGVLAPSVTGGVRERGRDDPQNPSRTWPVKSAETVRYLRGEGKGVPLAKHDLRSGHGDGQLPG